MNILIGGIGGDIGLGAARILKAFKWNGKVYGSDITSNHPGHHECDQCFILPHVESDNFQEILEKLINDFSIALYIPTSEAEIRFLNKHSIRKISKAKVLLTNKLLLEISLDKYICLKFLDSKGINVPEHGLVGQNEPKKYPVIIKPREGSGSKDLSIINSLSHYRSFKPPTNVEMIWQQYLMPDEEYTCPVFRSRATGTRTMIIKRTLLYGFTYSGEVVENELINQYLYDITDAVELNGIMNVQLRLTQEGPLLFEINPRLSSTVMFRHLMNFQDLIWWIYANSSIPVPDYYAPKAGTKFYRGLTEYIDK